jgi:hypothetical protein
METKTRNFIILVLIVSLCPCCSSEDGTLSSNTSPEGSWQFIVINIETAFDFNNDGIVLQNLFEETPCYDGGFTIFDS